jgi:hypothetical protein
MFQKILVREAQDVLLRPGTPWYYSPPPFNSYSNFRAILSTTPAHAQFELSARCGEPLGSKLDFRFKMVLSA